MAVLWHHAPVYASWGSAHQLATRGFLGVDMFFVLSGFLITTLLLRERDRTGRISLAGFYTSRARRILPPYFLVVTAVAGYYIVAKGQAHWLSVLPYYYVFLANFIPEDIPLLSPMWSLAVEEQYYLVWPLLLVFLPDRWLLPVLGGLVAVNVFGVLGLLAPLGFRAFDAGPLHFALPNATYAPILMGSAGAIILHHARGFTLLWGLLSRMWAAPIALLGVLLVAGWGPVDVRGWPNLVLHTLMVYLLLALVAQERGPLTPFLAARPVARLGKVSYGVYLYHLIGLYIANQVFDRLGLTSPWLVFLAYSCLAWLLAEASFRWWESRFLQGSRASLMGQSIRPHARA